MRRGMLCLGLGVLALTANGLRADDAEQRSLRAVEVSNGEPEQRALRAIKALKGSVTRNEKAPDRPVIVVDLSFTGLTDAGLKDLAGLKQLQKLVLSGTSVTDAGMQELAGLKQLQKLELLNTEVTDAGLKELAGLKQLHMLDLSSTKVTERRTEGSRRTQTTPDAGPLLDQGDGRGTERVGRTQIAPDAGTL